MTGADLREIELIGCSRYMRDIQMGMSNTQLDMQVKSRAQKGLSCRYKYGSCQDRADV